MIVRPFLFLIFSSISLAADIQCAGGYNNGDKFKEGNFVKQCVTNANGYAINIVGCVSPKGTVLNIGDYTLEEYSQGIDKIACVSLAGGSVKLQSNPVSAADAAILRAALAATTKAAAATTPTTLKTTTAAQPMKCNNKYSNGEKFNDGNFVKQCTSSAYSWATTVVACLTPLKKEIAIGGKATEGPLTYLCTKSSTGVKLQTEMTASEDSGATNMKCYDKYSNGETFVEGSFSKLCTSTPNGYSVTINACLSPKKQEIPVGKTLTEGNLIYSCVKTATGVTIQSEPAVKGCENGKYSKGQTYLSSNGRFFIKCLDDYGSTSILACKTDDGQEVKVGAQLIVGQINYRCAQETDGSVRYYKEPITKNSSAKGCGQYTVGQSVMSTDGYFKFNCVSDGKIVFTACVVDKGVEVAADTDKVIGNMNYACKTTSNGGGSLLKTLVK